MLPAPKTPRQHQLFRRALVTRDLRSNRLEANSGHKPSLANGIENLALSAA